MKNWLKGGLIGSIIGTLIYIFLILVHLNSRANKRYFFKPLIILSILFYGIIFAIIWAKKEDKEKSSYFSKGFLTGIIFGILSFILSFTISEIKHIYWGLQVGSSPIWGNIQEILNPLYIFGDLIGLIFDMPGFGIHSLISITLTIIGYGLIGVIIYYIIQKIESKLQEQPQQEATI